MYIITRVNNFKKNKWTFEISKRKVTNLEKIILLLNKLILAMK